MFSPIYIGEHIRKHTMRSRLENIIVLVNRNSDKENQERCVFDLSAIKRLQYGRLSSLPLTSHPGMALGFQRESYVEMPNDWILLNLAVVPMNDSAPQWKYDNKYLSTIYDDYEFVVDINMWRFEERTKLNILRGVREKKHKARSESNDDDGRNGRVFVLNEIDGTISPRDETELYLGRMGSFFPNQLLMEAVWMNNISEAERLITDELADVNYTNEINSPLSNACIRGDVDMVSFLLENGAIIENESAIKYSPLNVACYFGHREIIKLLISNGGDVNKEDGSGTTPIAAAALAGNNQIVVELIDDHDVDINTGRCPAISQSIRNSHTECLELLLEKGVLLNNRYDAYDTALHQACAMGIIRGNELVDVLLLKRGNLFPHIMPGKDWEVLLNSYANLNERDLSRCIDRSFSKFGAEKTLLYCIQHATLAWENARQLRSVDVASAENQQKLCNHLQLGAAAILKVMFKDDTAMMGYNGALKIIKCKEDKLEEFMANHNCQKALFIAKEMRLKVFFSQPEPRAYICKLWYGKGLNETFDNAHGFKWENTFKLLVAFCVLLLQIPLLPVTIILPILPKDSNIRKWKYFFTHPIIRFIYNCVLDLTLAILFMMLDLESSSLSLYWKYPLLFTLGGMCALEFRKLNERNSLKAYFKDPFNYFDLPGLLFAISAVMCIFFSSTNGILVTILLCLASLFLWLRVLRFLTLLPPLGPLVLMLFRMFGDVVRWVTMLFIVVLAFMSCVQKLKKKMETIEGCDGVSFHDFLEDTLLGEEVLFDCMEKLGHLAVFGILIVFIFFLIGNVLLLNMLIAMMTESFASVWDAQAENYLLQRASYCIEMYDEKDLPFAVFYFPFFLLNLVKKLLGLKPESRFILEETNHDDGSDEEPTLNNYFYEYIKKYQNEFAGEERWRSKLNKKIGDTDQKVEELSARNEKKIDELTANSVRNEKKIDELTGKMNELTMMMKQLLETD